jgi:N-acetylmuramoyl-L-alanine amidase
MSMRRRLLGVLLLPLVGTLASVNETAAASIETVSASSEAASASLVRASADYPIASSRSASTSNYTVANRPHDYPVDIIVIHDIEGSYGSAIRAFRNPARLASAHYVISYRGQITQMVAEKDIAWHAGNWDYNTRAIGIEHEGFAYTYGLYTSAEYHASAHLAASICSRWGVPMDRRHVIGHYQVPDPYHPGLYGGADHHTDPGPYWRWTYYMALAKAYSLRLPSPPHMMLAASAFSGDGTATVSWRPARTCHTPIASYSVVAQPGNIQMTVPGTVTTASFTGLTNGVDYSFTVTAHNSYGQGSAGSNVVTPGPSCTSASLTVTPASPSSVGGAVRFTATSTGCSNPQYEFWLESTSGTWAIQKAFGGSSWSWENSYAYAPGTYTIRVWANHATSDTSRPETFTDLTYVLNPFSMSHWSASYDMSKAPTSWVAGQSQTFPVTVTNTGDVTWPSTGYGKVDFDLHFATQPGGSANQAYWLSSGAVAIPADLAAGDSLTLTVTFAAPSNTSARVLEAEMIKEHQFWFQQWQPVNVTVAPPVWSASYDMSRAPTSWAAGQKQTFPITVTNTGNMTWASTGYTKVDLDLHFTTQPGGSANQAYWLNSGALSIPADLAPGASVTLTVTFTAPSGTGPMFLEAEMIKEHQFWFQQVSSIPVNVS